MAQPVLLFEAECHEHGGTYSLLVLYFYNRSKTQSFRET